MVQLQVLIFTGENPDENANTVLRIIEYNVAEATKDPVRGGDMKCTILAAYVAGDARVWHSRQEKAVQDTWDLPKTAFKLRFPVIRVQQENQTSVFHDIANLRQGNKTLRDYLDESFTFSVV